MNNQKPSKKAQTGLVEDARITITNFQEEEKKDKFKAQKDPIGYINKQGPDSIQQKLKLPFYSRDCVVLLKDFPSQDLYKGYFCVIIALAGYEGDKNNNPKLFYDVEFNSSFAENDPSQKSLQQCPDFEFPTETIPGLVAAEDMVRVEFQDLQYKTYFGL